MNEFKFDAVYRQIYGLFAFVISFIGHSNLNYIPLKSFKTVKRVNKFTELLINNLNKSGRTKIRVTLHSKDQLI